MTKDELYQFKVLTIQFQDRCKEIAKLLKPLKIVEESYEGLDEVYDWSIDIPEEEVIGLYEGPYDDQVFELSFPMKLLTYTDDEVAQYVTSTLAKYQETLDKYKKAQEERKTKWNELKKTYGNGQLACIEEEIAEYKKLCDEFNM